MTKSLGKKERQHREKREYWGNHLAEWEKSGKSQSEYCRKAGVSFRRFQAWKAAIYAGHQKRPKRAADRERIKLVRLDLEKLKIGLSGENRFVSANSVGLIRIWVKGCCVEVSDRFSETSLRSVLGILRGN